MRKRPLLHFGTFANLFSCAESFERLGVQASETANSMRELQETVRKFPKPERFGKGYRARKRFRK
jgi:ubiquinone/menaquinone biosynthesis C-methylase UbiE